MFTERFAYSVFRVISTPLNDRARNDRARNDRARNDRARSGVIAAGLVSLLFFVNMAGAQVVPYITDVVGLENMDVSVVRGKSDDGDLRLIGTFKLFNPDTVPFYLWVSFENGGRLANAKARSGSGVGKGSEEESSTIRLVDLELRYKNDFQQPVVKVFPRESGYGPPPVRKRIGWGVSGRGVSNAGKFGKKKSHVKRAVGVEAEAEAAGEGSAVTVRGGGRGGAAELVFWREDAQGYYEMELWGVLYAPDLKKAVVAGNYVENIQFEVEAAQ